MKDISNNIFSIMSDVFEVPLGDVSSDSSIDNIGSWDSLRHLNLILALEEEFDISIPDEEVGNLVNYKIIELVVKEQMK